MWLYVAWLMLLAGGCMACDMHLVHVSRHVRLAGREQRLQRLSSHIDNVRFSLEYQDNSVIREDEWTLDIDYKTTTCLPTDEGSSYRLDEADEALLVSEARPDVGYVSYSGTVSLKLHGHPLDWQFAQIVCEREGATLAVVDTPDKVKALQDLLHGNPEVLRASVLGQQVLVGINDVRLEGFFETSKGAEFRPWNNTVWLPNEPDNAAPGEDCVTFHVIGRIRDVPCYYELPYVCERDDP